MSVAAIVALAHDLLITVGIYALSGFEVTPATVTGVLTILGLLALRHRRGLRQGAREHQEPRAHSRQTYAEAANLAVNQTLVRSINTSIVALIPVGAILYVGAVQLGSGALKDLALALFVGMAAGAYSSIFIATPLLAQLKSRRDRASRSRRSGPRRARRHEADRYAVGAGVHRGHADRRPSPTRPTAPRADGRAGGDAGRRPPAAPGDARRDRPRARRARRRAARCGRAASAGRAQPSRQPRSKRGKK